jgi:RNA polymerase sigma-70 factor (ECF subfamily)
MPPRDDDEQLIAAAGQGDTEAFRALVERHHAGVIRFVQRFLGTREREAAEDIAQEVFLAAWKAAPRFRPRARVLTWLLRISANASLTHRRAAARRKTQSLDAAAETPSSATDDDPAAAALRGERADELAAAVDALPDKQRAAIILRHYHDLSYSEIAETLETSVSAVETLLFRARGSLGRRLAMEESAKPQVSPPIGVQSTVKGPVR